MNETQDYGSLGIAVNTYNIIVDCRKMSDKLQFVEGFGNWPFPQTIDKLKFVGHWRPAFLLGFLDHNILWPPTAIPKEPGLLKQTLDETAPFLIEPLS